MQRTSRNGWVLTVLSSVLALLVPLSAQDRANKTKSCQWGIAGEGLANSWSQPQEHSISPLNVRNLGKKWVFKAGGDVSATPTVCDDVVYFPDWSGSLTAVDAASGHHIWSHKISSYDGSAGAVARVSPAVDRQHDQLIVGDVLSTTQAHNGANVMAVDLNTGALRWITHVDSHPAAIITGSPVVFDGVIYVGVSSIEETLALDPTYACCTFRGSVVALEAKTGAILWQTFDMPDNHDQPGQYSGGAVWQPPAIDPQRGLLYIGTGNNYDVPASVAACQDATPMKSCSAHDDYYDTALALELKTGKVKWSHKLESFDTWTLACLSAAGTNPNCPVHDSPDFDLGGAGPNLIGNIVGFGQKSGIFWALDADTGKILWSTPVGPGGNLGGVEWGTATDGERIYVAIANSLMRPFTLVPSGQQITWGAWSALDVKTGKILWQTADPTPGSIDRGSVSVANGVMYAGSNSGEMYALDAKTGAILWNFASGGTVLDGPSIVDGVLYWGSGYKNLDGTSNNKVFAFTLPN